MVKLYWMSVSHPSQAARKMLERKRVDFKLVDVLPLNQRVHMRLAGFRGGTVPGLRIDGRRVQGSRQIARVLDELWPQPPLFPSDPSMRARVKDAERWGDEQLQPIPRRLARFGATYDVDLREWAARLASLPAPAFVARVSGLGARYYARTIESDGRRGDEASVRADLAALPAMLDRVDTLLAEGTISAEPNAASYQILATVRLLDLFTDLHPYVAERPCAEPARSLFPDYPGPLPPFLPTEWLPPAA